MLLLGLGGNGRNPLVPGGGALTFGAPLFCSLLGKEATGWMRPEVGGGLNTPEELLLFVLVLDIFMLLFLPLLFEFDP